MATYTTASTLEEFKTDVIKDLQREIDRAERESQSAYSAKVRQQAHGAFIALRAFRNYLAEVQVSGPLYDHGQRKKESAAENIEREQQ